MRFRLARFGLFLALAASVVAMGDAPTSRPASGGTQAAPAEQVLKRRLAELSMDGVSFKQAIDLLREASGANFYVRWNVLEQAGVNPDTPVSLKVHDITLARTLRLILDSAETPGSKLGYYIHENVITISLSHSQNTDLITKVYDITDLMYVIPDIGRNGDGTRTSSGNARSNAGGGARR